MSFTLLKVVRPQYVGEVGNELFKKIKRVTFSETQCRGETNYEKPYYTFFLIISLSQTDRVCL